MRFALIGLTYWIRRLMAGRLRREGANEREERYFLVRQRHGRTWTIKYVSVASHFPEVRLTTAFS